ncbi:DUF72 domain-containing protein [Agromyces albus]|uniref:DUF72 domain-containing protein n=1 Tax=Agromyces albus TaxID=205332 RepID=A0A4Q2L5H3_9MICO|nr:DUF72 domain-containing protein [Agromyces albus]RXZ72929.1 DUF72 domain-containing protein [Agromyces albus]
MTVWIGTSGWSFGHWDGVLYEPGLPPSQRLARYVESFRTVELNASYYRWPPDRTFASWRRRLPEGFAMSVKAPRGLTHAKRLYAPEAWIRRVAASWHELGERRAVLLVQLPPSLARDDARLDYFLADIPEWMRVAVEFRHESWHVEPVFELLARHGAAYCVMSGANLPCVLRTTAGLVYVRLHGPDHDHLYGGSYSDADLGWWADRIREWAGSGRDVYAYFNNDGGGNAVRNAWRLRQFVDE